MTQIGQMFLIYIAGVHVIGYSDSAIHRLGLRGRVEYHNSNGEMRQRYFTNHSFPARDDVEHFIGVNNGDELFPYFADWARVYQAYSMGRGFISTH